MRERHARLSFPRKLKSTTTPTRDIVLLVLGFGPTLKATVKKHQKVDTHGADTTGAPQKEIVQLFIDSHVATVDHTPASKGNPSTIH